MFKTNSASYGGFLGISNSYGAALWGLDYALQMAYSNFSGALFHVGGQNVYYNPFTRMSCLFSPFVEVQYWCVHKAPPTNQSAFHQWTIGPIVSNSFDQSSISYLSLGCQYYAALVVAETFRFSGSSQILNLNANNGNIFTPGYAVYEGGSLSKLALFNFMMDPSGNNDYTATISIKPVTILAQVKVKYLSAPSVSSKNNITWAGQTFGANFASDGRLQGDLNIQTIPCDTNSNTCPNQGSHTGFCPCFFLR